MLTDEEIRAECLRQASAKAHDASDVIPLAKTYLAFITNVSSPDDGFVSRDYEEMIIAFTKVLTDNFYTIDQAAYVNGLLDRLRRNVR